MALRKLGLFSGKIDGQYGAILGKALGRFLVQKGASDTVLSPGGEGMKALAAAVPSPYQKVQAWRQTPFLFVVTGTAATDPWQRGEYTLPDTEFDALKRALRQVAFVRQLGLSVAETSVTTDGRFMVRLAFPGVEFVDPFSANLTKRPPAAFLRLLQNDLPMRGWQTVAGTDLIFKTTRSWPVLKQSKDVTLEQFDLIGLKRRPSEPVLAACSAAIATSLLSDKPDKKQAKELMQCFGRDRLTMEQKAQLRTQACANLQRKWHATLGHLGRVHDALNSILPLYTQAHIKRVQMSRNFRARTAENLEIGLHNAPAVDTAKTISDILRGNKTLGEITGNIATGTDAPDAAIHFLESIGKETAVGVVKAFDLASLWLDTKRTFENALKNTTELPEWYRLVDLQQQLWIGFYNGFAELEEIWPEQVRLLQALHAQKCPIPTEDAEAVWVDLLSLHRTLFSMQPILDVDEFSRLPDVRGQRDKLLVWQNE